MPVVIALVVFVLGGVLLTRTVAGVRTYAIGGNAAAARLAGVQVERHVTALYVYCGLSMGLVATLTTAQLASGTPQTGVGFELDVLTAVILGGVGFAGGTGRPLGIFIGVVTIGILNSGLSSSGCRTGGSRSSRAARCCLRSASTSTPRSGASGERWRPRRRRRHPTCSPSRSSGSRVTTPPTARRSRSPRRS